MLRESTQVKVFFRSDSYLPQTFRWRGRIHRVQSIEGIRTCGFERRYRLRTVEGMYELSLDAATGAWRMRRTPSWWGRFLAELAEMPRYPLPAWRRRTRYTAPAHTASREGGDHAIRFALVRQ